MTSKIQRLTMLLKLPLEGRMITSSELVLRTGGCLSWHYKEEAKGSFPSRIQIGERGVAWAGDELAAWLNARVENS